MLYFYWLKIKTWYIFMVLLIAKILLWFSCLSIILMRKSSSLMSILSGCPILFAHEEKNVENITPNYPIIRLVLKILFTECRTPRHGMLTLKKLSKVNIWPRPSIHILFKFFPIFNENNVSQSVNPLRY